MREIEVKILEVNRKELEKKLKSLGAKKVFDEEMIAIAYHNDQNMLLRIRKEGKYTKLCVKQIVSRKGAKISDEFEVKLDDFTKAKQIMEKLGYKQKITTFKRRISYQLDDVKFEFDKYKKEYAWVPEFMEIEAKDKKTILKYAKILGFKSKDLKPWSFKDLLKHYNKQ